MPRIKLSVAPALVITLWVGWLILAACGDATPINQPTRLVPDPTTLPTTTTVFIPPTPTRTVLPTVTPLPTRSFQTATAVPTTASITSPPAATTLPGALPTRTTSATDCPSGSSGGGSSTLTTIQQIDAYICKLTLSQQIGELLMIPVYANTYTSDYDVYLQQYQIANAIMFTAYNNGIVKPKTLVEFRQLTQAVIAHSPNPMIIATDEEGGIVDRIAPYYGPSPSPATLGASGDPKKAYTQGQIDAIRLKDIGINVDFAPLADVYQGGAIEQSRMFGSVPSQVTQYAGAFLDGLQQNGVMGTLKHWPGIGAANANPDYSMPTITKTKAELNATDFLTFRNLLSHNPGMIMVTHVIEPAYDPKYPASLSPILIDSVLRGELGYQGVVVSDAMEAGAIGEYMKSVGYTDPAQAIGEASVLAILAGEDIIECPSDGRQIEAMVKALTKAVQSGRITSARLKLSLERIVALKVKMGLIILQS